MNLKKLKRVVKKLTGLKLITFIDAERLYRYDWIGDTCTCLKANVMENTLEHIFLNIQEVRDMAGVHKARGMGIKNIYLKAVLHEIAHARQILKCKNIKEFDDKYHKNQDYYENMADRYARLNYKKVLLALDKV